MRRLPSSLAFLTCLSVLAAPGQAQTPRPSPDYHARVWVAGFETPLEIRQSGLRRRIEVAQGGLVQTYIADRVRGSLTVMTAGGQGRVAFVFPLPREEQMSPLPLDLLVIERGAARMNRVGASNIAGRSCERYRYSGYLGRAGSVCATREGVILELHPDGRQRPLYRVISLTPARQAATWFAPTPDYQLAVLPGVGGTVGAPATTTPQPSS